MEDDPKTYTPAKPGRFFVIGWIGAIAAALILTAGLVLARELWLGRQTSDLEREYQQGRRVIVSHVIRGGGQRSIKLPASIHGYIETPIYAKVAGYLKEIDVDKGDRVKQGQVLALLEAPEIDNQVRNARATYNIASITDKRNQELVRNGVVAQQ